jgi:hypothetical protein
MRLNRLAKKTNYFDIINPGEEYLDWEDLDNTGFMKHYLKNCLTITTD